MVFLTFRLVVEGPTLISEPVSGKIANTDLVKVIVHRISTPTRLPAEKLGMILDRGHDFPEHIQEILDSYGKDMWLYRDDPTRGTTRAMNKYIGDHRGYDKQRYDLFLRR